MANTYTQIHLHIVFAVKFRLSMIQQSWKDELYKYITGIIQNNKHKVLTINGMPDHVHILIGMRPSQSLSELMQDEDVTNHKGIYLYVLTRDEKYLNIRAFNDKQKRKAYERQKSICPKCKKHFNIEEMEADHITPWHEGGKTTSENCQMLCKEDNRRKSGK